MTQTLNSETSGEIWGDVWGDVSGKNSGENSDTVLGQNDWICQAPQDRTLTQLLERNRQLEQQLAEHTAALARARAQIEHLSHLDDLTQIANRRRFDRDLYQEWKRLARERSTWEKVSQECWSQERSSQSSSPEEQPMLTLILAEVDQFRSYGDRYGPLAADQCLYRVAQMLKAIALRPADLVCRYGPSTFALLLPRTPAAGAVMLAQRIHQGMVDLRLDRDPEELGKAERRGSPRPLQPSFSHVTLSLGIAITCPQGETLPTLLIEYAATALDEAKSGGRDPAALGPGYCHSVQTF
jgi:diguanylate cyclase (GGDEF)-like protein